MKFDNTAIQIPRISHCKISSRRNTRVLLGFFDRSTAQKNGWCHLIEYSIYFIDYISNSHGLYFNLTFHLYHAVDQQKKSKTQMAKLKESAFWKATSTFSTWETSQSTCYNGVYLQGPVVRSPFSLNGG